MILVTGGTGMAGSFVVHELQERGYGVLALTRPASVQVAEDLGAEVALGDLADPESVRRAAKGVQGIVHVACTFTQPEVDIAAMETLLEAWERGPFVFLSTVDVYGYARYVPVDEDHPLDEGYSGYARGKARCERLLQEAAQARGGDDFSILRLPHIWGPHPRCRSRLVDQRLLEDQPIALPGATQEEWSRYGDAWEDTRELAWAAAECLERPLGEAANTISGHFVWHDFYTELVRLLDSSSPIQHLPLDEMPEDAAPGRKSFYAQSWRYSGTRLKERLDFQPARRWQDTLAEVVAIER